MTKLTNHNKVLLKFLNWLNLVHIYPQSTHGLSLVISKSGPTIGSDYTWRIGRFAISWTVFTMDLLVNFVVVIFIITCHGISNNIAPNGHSVLNSLFGGVPLTATCLMRGLYVGAPSNLDLSILTSSRSLYTENIVKASRHIANVLQYGPSILSSLRASF